MKTQPKDGTMQKDNNNIIQQDNTDTYSQDNAETWGGNSDNIFELATPKYLLRTTGMRTKVQVPSWDGMSVAAAAAELFADLTRSHVPAKDQILVGLIPFDTSQAAHLLIPETVDWAAASENTKASATIPCDAGLTNEPIGFKSNNLAAPSDNEPNQADLEQKVLTTYGIDSPIYRQSVTEAVAQIQAGQLDKVVLARQLRLWTRHPVNPEAVFKNLRQNNPNAYNFRVNLPDGGGVLLGASPELIMSATKGALRSFPLAGSAPHNKNPTTDRRVADKLLESSKNLEEHALVVQAISTVLAQYASDLEVPQSPQLVSTPVLWHLGSDITAKLRSECSILEVLYDMHPTPAVGGWPAEKAKHLIDKLEGEARGFFAGLAGWIDGEGNGEWALVLRCGIVKKKTISLFAGAGIVADSDPVEEHRETDTKFLTFANALEPELQTNLRNSIFSQRSGQFDERFRKIYEPQVD